MIESYSKYIISVRFCYKQLKNIVIPFSISFEELKCVICEKIEYGLSRRISCILYRYPLPIFGGFVQFQTKYVTDEASMQEMFSMYIESRTQISFIEVYVEFEQSKADQNIKRKDYNSDSEKEFESNYEVVGPDGDEDQSDGTMAPTVTDLANALTNEYPFEEPSFMRVLDLKAMHTTEFPEYMNAEIPVVADGEFAVEMEFSSKEAVIMAMKDYTIRKSVDYRVYESESLTFFAKCTQYGSGYDWLIRVSMISRKYCWVIRKYNGSHTCTKATISQDHSKLDSNRIAEAIKSLVEADPSIKVKSVIAKVQSKFNYTISYRKVWLANKKSVKKYLEVEKHHTKLCLYDLRSCVIRSHHSKHRTYKTCRQYRQNEVFEVREMPSRMEYAVDLRRQQCDCGEFQIRKCIFMMCIRWTKFDGFRPLGNPTILPAYNGPRFVPKPYLRRVNKGRPRMMCFLNEMDTRMLRRPRRCRQCGTEGHIHK
ncbi:hypothetical protein Ahy_A03g011641 [Arachis hypogaea]|uniref:Uncharacterized protein n=1 Tax=Arachis hypogaea TaxID=3818 RepID=A0A445DRB8_ARAHY|nr:hypothetical protein Ahy_A03g011641 [Arachis hypogaea]